MDLELLVDGMAETPRVKISKPPGESPFFAKPDSGSPNRFAPGRAVDRLNGELRRDGGVSLRRDR